MALYEWRITDLGEDEYGYIRIGQDEDDDRIHISVDNCELFPNSGGCECYERILAYWQSIGSPVADRTAPGHEAPWFPWNVAGFPKEELAKIMRNWNIQPG